MSAARQRSQTVALGLLLCGLAAACSADISASANDDWMPEDDGNQVEYFQNKAFRRERLLESLVNRENGYSSERVEHYASGGAGDWEALPVWNPPAGPFQLDAALRSAIAEGAAPIGMMSPIAIPQAAAEGDPAALRSLGEAAFFGYPAQILGIAEEQITAASARDYGLWSAPSAPFGGLVRVQMADGSVGLAVTCSTCHAQVQQGALVAGLPNADFDIGRWKVESFGTQGPLADAMLAWGPGRLDVTTDTGLEPVRIPDLRPVQDLPYLQADATVRQRDLVDLAIRIETLIITSNNDEVRPPREIALGLAFYLWSLVSELPGGQQAATATAEADKVTAGESLFASECARCHLPPGLSGPPVPLDVVGTDPVIGRSSVRGTGSYRVPSLHGVGTRGPLLHDGTVVSLDAMFDPARLAPSYVGGRHGPGPIAGHPFGLELETDARAALLAYLGSL